MYKKSLVFIAFIFLKFEVFAQAVINSVPIDSVAEWELKKLYKPLEMDSVQAIGFRTAFKDKLASIAAFQAGNLTLAERKLLIRRVDNRFNKKLQSIFSAVQNKKYKEEQQNQRLMFMKDMRDKKIKVFEVDDDE